MNRGLLLTKATALAMFIVPAPLKVLNELGIGPTSLQAQDIYLDESGGNDATGDGSLGAPWKTIDKLNLQYPNGLPSSTTLHLARGGEYPGQIKVASGAQDVNVEAFPLVDSEDRPVVYGSIEPTWTQEGTSDVWYTQIPANIVPKYLFQAGIRKPQARYPNTGWIRNSACTNGGGSSTIEGSPFPSNINDLLHAQLVARTYNWQYQLSKVTSIASPAVVCTPAVQPMGTYDWGFFFEGTYALMDAVGEWCFVDAEDRVYYKTGSTSAAPQDVRVAIHDFGVTITGGSPITQGVHVQEIHFAHQMEAGVALRGDGLGSHDIQVDHCDFNDLAIGIDDRNSAASPGGNTIAYNTFTDVYDRAVLHYADASSITNNRFERIGMVPGLGKSGFGGYMGMDVGGDDYTVEFNTFHDIGYAAINAGGQGTIAHNHIERCLAILNDGGGIQFDNSDHMVIENNVITNVGDPAVNLVTTGSVNTSGTAYFAYEPISYGIYFGNLNITNATVQDNVVSGCDKGIHVDHSLCSTNQQILGNTLFNNRVQLSMTDYSNYTNVDPSFCGGDGDNSAGNQGYGPTTDYPNYITSYDDTYSDNITYCLSGAQRCLEQSHVWPGSLADLVDFGSFSDNYYHNPFSEAPFLIATKYRPSGFSGYSFDFPMSLAEWQAQFEPSASGSPLSLSDNLVTSTDPTALLDDDFESGLSTLWGCNLPGTRALEGTTNHGLRSTGSPWIERVYECPPSQAPVAGKYRLSFQLSATSPGSFLAGFRYRDLGGYLGYRTFTAGTTPRDYSLVVDVDDPPGNDWMYFYIGDGQLGAGVHANTSSLLIDNVLVEECTTSQEFTDQIALDHILRYYADLPGTEADPQNVAATDGSFELIGCWSDVEGTIWSGTVTLVPWESKVLYRIENEYDIDVESYDVDAGDAIPSDGEEVWDTPKNVRGSVVVEDGETLIVDGVTIGFADSRQDGEITNIIIEPGGTLQLINGAVLTTIPDCGDNSMWDGVRVLSYYDPEGVTLQSYPGQVIMESGATISNALVGILSGEGDPMAPGFVNSTENWYGGVIDATDAVFLNNRFDVVAKQWISPEGILSSPPMELPTPTWIRFVGTDFLTTDPLNYTGLAGQTDLHPVAHLRVADNEPLVHACTFANDIGSHTESALMGHGIEAFNAYLNVGPCIQGTCPEGSDEGNVFRNLDHAVHASVFDGSAYTHVHGNAFTDNICAVYLSGVPGFSVVDNDIEMGKWEVEMATNPDELNWNGFHRGIFSTEGFGFSIQDNDLGLSAGASPPAPTEGIVVGYSNDHDDIVFNNTAAGLDRGFIGEGLCANPTDPVTTGLQFQCNENYGNATNFMGRMVPSGPGPQEHTIRARQGSYLLASGNTLDQTGSPVQLVIDTDNEFAPIVFYYYDEGSSPGTPNTSWVESNGSQLLLPTVTDGAPINPCTELGPGVIGGGEDLETLPDIVQTNKEEYEVLELLYDQMMDGGDTQELLDALVAAWYEGTYEVTEEFLELSPFISGDVLAQLALSEDFTNAQKAAIFIANPEGTQGGGIIRILRGISFPEELIELIEASWTEGEITYRAQLEMEMSGYHTNLVQAANHWVHLLQTDALAADLGTLRSVWQQVRKPAARYAEAALLMGIGDYEEADAVITDMAAENELSEGEEAEQGRMIKYISILADAVADDRSAYHLDSLEVAVLDSMVAENYDRPSVWARNLLCSVYGICHPPCTGGEEGEPQARHITPPAPVRTSLENTLFIQPNPASNGVAFSYALPGNRGTVMLTVRDINGRLVAQFTAGGEAGARAWSVQDLPAGVYSVELVRDGKLMSNERLIVQH